MKPDDTDVTVVRQQDFECEGPVELSVELGGGRLHICLVEGATGARTVDVQVRPDLTGGPPWNAGIAGLLSWIGDQAGAAPWGDLAAEAARRTVIDFIGRRLVVRTPQDAPLRNVPLTIQVSAPSGSSVLARSGSADVAVDGVADLLDAATGSGQVRAQECTGAIEVRTGSGDVRLGLALGALRVRTGSGAVEVISIGAAGPGPDGAGIVQTGSGNVRFGAVHRDVLARSGRGDLTVVDATAGRIELISGSGRLRVGVHAGVWAELDISSGSGQVRSELPVSGPPADGKPGLWVSARTGSGEAVVTAAPV